MITEFLLQYFEPHTIVMFWFYGVPVLIALFGFRNMWTLGISLLLATLFFADMIGAF